MSARYSLVLFEPEDIGARYPLVSLGPDDIDARYSLVLFGPEDMGALRVDGLQQGCGLVPSTCTMALIVPRPNGQLRVLGIPNAALWKIRADNTLGFLDSAASGAAALALRSSSLLPAMMSSGAPRQSELLLRSSGIGHMVKPLYVGTDIDVPMSRFMDDVMADFMFTEVVE